MTEEFLHHIWKFRLFDNKELVTSQNEPLEIIHVGEHNTDAGPDFFNARLKIGNTVWAGNVEIHINSSDWNKHNHSEDKAYDNIILHVVFNEDVPLKRRSGDDFPTLVLKNRISLEMYNKYLALNTNKDWIACGKQVSTIDAFHLNSWLDRLVIERMERKSITIIDSLHLNKNNWEETFYQHLARNFGFKINAEPFQLLAKATPLAVLGKHKNSLLQIESILFGQAGLLEKHFTDKYPQQLQNEYAFLKNKFKLQPIDAHLWKLMRLRPSNFPAIRISQFASLIFKSTHLFAKIIESESVNEIHDLFEIEASEYWNEHYTFEKKSPSKVKPFGKDSIDNIIINSIVPFLFAYGKQKSEERFIEKAMRFLDATDSESNSIIKNWNDLGIKTKSAYQSQALLQLKNEYCNQKKCLQCSVGNKLLSVSNV